MRRRSRYRVNSVRVEGWKGEMETRVKGEAMGVADLGWKERVDRRGC